MARKTRQAKKRRAADAPASGRAFKCLAMHVTEAKGRHTFAALRAERATSAAESLAATRPHNLDPESAAKRILAHTLESGAAADLTAPKVGDDEATGDDQAIGDRPTFVSAHSGAGASGSSTKGSPRSSPDTSNTR